MTFDIDSLDSDEAPATSALYNRLTGFLTSMLLHCAFLVVLALMVFSEQNPIAGVISLYASESESDGTVDLLELDVAAESLQGSSPSASELFLSDVQSEIDVTMDVSEEEMTPDISTPPQNLGSLSDIALAASLKSSQSDRTLFEKMTEKALGGKSYDGPLLKSPKDGVRQTKSAADAALGILDQLRGANEHEGPVWILWVMDASISLAKERQQLAPLVRDFYEQVSLAKKPGRYPWPTTAVFAFGQGVLPLGMNRGRPQPTDIASTLINVPIDESGVENVMTAVAAAVSSVPFKNRNTRIEVVVWSDEAGDDLYRLENLILLCQQRNARVHVVGPLSVFGMRKGLQQHTLPPPFDQQPILLPVDRGPDSAFPERAQLPYWYESTDIDWGNGPIIPANLGGQNFGGPHRQRLLAPSGPYGLTRLALATGGTFTAINRPGDIASATRDELFDYMPDYRSAMEIAYDIDQYPLRRAIIEAAALTDTVRYWPPRMDFPSSISTIFPYRAIHGRYISPQRFARRLPDDLEISVKGLRQAQMMIERAIQTMTFRFQGEMESQSESESSSSEFAYEEISLQQITPREYHYEESPRWKAWYDLNLGRLLAHSVRIHEYIVQCEYLAVPSTRTMMAQNGYNRLRMVPSQQFKGGPVSASRTSAAVKLLERVIQDHPDTPWGDLAKWELAHPVGVEPVLSVVPPPKPVVGPVIRTPKMPRPTLPKL